MQRERHGTAQEVPRGRPPPLQRQRAGRSTGRLLADPRPTSSCGGDAGAECAFEASPFMLHLPLCSSGHSSARPLLPVTYHVPPWQSRGTGTKRGRPVPGMEAKRTVVSVPLTCRRAGGAGRDQKGTGVSHRAGTPVVHTLATHAAHLPWRRTRRERSVCVCARTRTHTHPRSLARLPDFAFTYNGVNEIKSPWSKVGGGLLPPEQTPLSRMV